MTLRRTTLALVLAGAPLGLSMHARADGGSNAKLERYAQSSKSALSTLQKHASNPLLRQALAGKRGEITLFWWPGKNYWEPGRGRFDRNNAPGELHEVVLNADGLQLKTTIQGAAKQGRPAQTSYRAASVDYSLLKKRIDPAWLSLARGGATAADLDQRVDAWINQNLP